MDDAPPTSCVTVWLERLKAGDAAATKPLWDGYFARLVALARARLRSLSRAVADEEDVALSAFDSFFRGVGEGRFPRLDDRDDLWQVLFVITTRKAIGLVRHETREKRGGQAPHGPTGGGASPESLASVAASDPPPELVAEVAEGCDRLLHLLGDGQLRQIAIWKMEGYTNAEIAGKIGRAVPTVERRLGDIRDIWRKGAV